MKLNAKEIVSFSLLGAIMFASKLITEFLPNIHFLAMFTIAYTVVFRKKALYPIFVFVLLTGLFYGFGTWWIPYFYLWPILWGAVMLLPKNLPDKVNMPIYMAVAFFHGLLYGTMYAPFQALVFGLNFKGMIAWIVAGFPWDVLQAVGNVCAATITVPVIKIIKKALSIN